MSDWLLLADGPGYQGLFADFYTTFWSGILRIAYAMVAAAPFLVAGMFAAGILRGMVGALYERIDGNEQFAADVAHEIKNPLASLRSAVGSLRICPPSIVMKDGQNPLMQL